MGLFIQCLLFYITYTAVDPIGIRASAEVAPQVLQEGDGQHFPQKMLDGRKLKPAHCMHTN